MTPRAHRTWSLVVVLALAACEAEESEPNEPDPNEGPIRRPESMSAQCWSYCEPQVRCLLSSGAKYQTDLMADCARGCESLESPGVCAPELERHFRCEGQRWANICGAAPFSADCVGDWVGEAFACVAESTAACTAAPGECRCAGTHPYGTPIEVSCVEVAEGGGGSGGGGSVIPGPVQCACKYDGGTASLCFQDELSCDLGDSCCAFL